MTRARIAVVMIAVAASTALSAAAERPAGVPDGPLVYSGAAEIPGMTVEFSVTFVEGDGGGWSATIDIPSQGARGLELADVALSGDGVSFGLPMVGATWTGELSPDWSTIEGDTSQAGMTFPFSLELQAADANAPGDEPDVFPEGTERWRGVVSLPGGIELEFFVTFRPEGDAYSATMDIPMQGLEGGPLRDVVFSDDVLEFTLAMAGAEWSLKREGDSAEGTLKQQGMTFPAEMRPMDEGESTALVRPQHPEPPFPYETVEVRFENVLQDGVELAGTLTIPQGEGPFPAAVLISGSGAQDRDESLLGHKPFLVLADHLTRRGIAVLRYDDRGVGDSTGDYAVATTADLATDAHSAVVFLKSRPEIDAARIGLIGHSEGGLIAPIVASEYGQVSFIVLLAGTGVPGDEILPLQLTRISEASGMSAEDVARQEAAQRTLFKEFRKDDPDMDVVRGAIGAMLEIQMADTPEDVRESLGGRDALIDQQIAQLSGAWFKYFLHFDPRTALRRVRCPVLAIIGELDTQVIAEQNLPEIERALRQGGNRDVTVVVLPGLNHLFQHAETGSPAEYAAIEETFAPEALRLVSRWVRAKTGHGR